VLQILAGTLLVANLFTVAAASSLVVFTIVATVMFLPFWTLPSGVEREHSINGFLSNVGVIGGLLLAAGVGA